MNISTSKLFFKNFYWKGEEEGGLAFSKTGPVLKKLKTTLNKLKIMIALIRETCL